MIIPFTLLFGAIGYFFYHKSKDDVSLDLIETLDSSRESIKEDDLYKDIEDLFI